MERRKVLLTEALNKFIEETSDASDSSGGDSIRYILSIGIIHSFKILYPDYSGTIDVLGKHKELLEECKRGEFILEKRKKNVIDALFECQKAIEHHNQQKEKKFI